MRLPDLDLRLYVPRPPFWLVALIVVSAVASWVPLALIAWQRASRHKQPRIHIFHDMDHQAKLKTQKASPVFADGRTMRPPVPGTVARGELREDEHFELGYRVTGTTGNEDGETVPEVAYLEGYPNRVEVTEALLKTGQLRYNTFCAPCHGISGNGQGTAHRRAVELSERGHASWTAVADLHQTNNDDELTFGQSLYPNGRLFHTISAGQGAMQGYAAQIDPADRWAIVAYVRALQLTQNPIAADPDRAENDPPDDDRDPVARADD